MLAPSPPPPFEAPPPASVCRPPAAEAELTLPSAALAPAFPVPRVQPSLSAAAAASWPGRRRKQRRVHMRAATKRIIKKYN